MPPRGDPPELQFCSKIRLRKKCRGGQNSPSGALGDVRSLWSLLTFGDFKLDLVAFLQALISFGTDGAIVDKNVRAICPSNEPVAFCVIKPLNRSFQTFHVPPAFRTPFTGGGKDVPAVTRMHFGAIM